MELGVRTWNLFHGRTDPPSDELYLEQMVRLVTADEPDVVCLQEVPVWALSFVEDWSGMKAYSVVATRSLLGPFGRRAQHFNPERIRSIFTGQANLLLIGPRLELVGPARSVRVSAGSRWQHRVCQLLPARADDRPFLIANVHATNDGAIARAELSRIAAVVAGADTAIVCGDFNVPATGLPDFSHPIAGIDQIVVRGLEIVSGPDPWPVDRRRVNGRVLSDHTPIEAVIA